ncbi:DUF4314 domain-containing protein [Streptococcus suis]
MKQTNLEKGVKILLLHMDDKYAPPIGSIGEVLGIDDIGFINVAWDNGSTLKLNPKIDKFYILF